MSWWDVLCLSGMTLVGGGFLAFVTPSPFLRRSRLTGVICWMAMAVLGELQVVLMRPRAGQSTLWDTVGPGRWRSSFAVLRPL